MIDWGMTWACLEPDFLSLKWYSHVTDVTLGNKLGKNGQIKIEENEVKIIRDLLFYLFIFHR